MSIELLPQPFDKFKESVERIKSRETDAQFLGRGAESNVWKVGEGESAYVVKLMNERSVRDRPRNTVSAAEGKVEAGLSGLGVVGLEQIIAASPTDGAVIYQYVEGTTAGNLSYEQVSKITQKQISSLCKTVEIASQRNIEIDGWNDSGGNIIYNPREGFTLIDYWQANRLITFELNRKFVLNSLGRTALRSMEL